MEHVTEVDKNVRKTTNLRYIEKTSDGRSIYKIIYSVILGRHKRVGDIENRGTPGRTRTCDPLLRRRFRANNQNY